MRSNFPVNQFKKEFCTHQWQISDYLRVINNFKCAIDANTSLKYGIKHNVWERRVGSWMTRRMPCSQLFSRFIHVKIASAEVNGKWRLVASAFGGRRGRKDSESGLHNEWIFSEHSFTGFSLAYAIFARGIWRAERKQQFAGIYVFVAHSIGS